MMVQTYFAFAIIAVVLYLLTIVISNQGRIIGFVTDTFGRNDMTRWVDQLKRDNPGLKVPDIQRD